MKFVFRTKSTFSQYLVFAIVLLLGGPALQYLNIESEIEGLITIIFLFILAIDLSDISTKGIVELSLTEEKILFRWVSKPFFARQEDRIIQLEEVIGWRFRREYQYNYFSIQIAGPEENLVLYRAGVWNDAKDDFATFLKEFRKYIEAYNKKQISVSESASSASEPRIIKDKERDFQNSNLAKLLSYIYVVAVLAGVLYIIMEWNSVSGARLGIIVSGIIGCMVLYFNQIGRQDNQSM